MHARIHAQHGQTEWDRHLKIAHNSATDTLNFMKCTDESVVVILDQPGLVHWTHATNAPLSKAKVRHQWKS